MKIHVGKRIWKTAFAVFVCLGIYHLRGEYGIPFFSTVTAILCMQPYVGNSREVAANQLLGTLSGAVFGLIALCVFNFINVADYQILTIVILSLFIIPVILIAVLIKKPEMSYLSCVVFFSIVATIYTDNQPLLYLVNRILDTVMGILVALVINSIDLPRKRRKDILFISSLDNALLRNEKGLSSFSKIELNRMISDGANFTVSTEQTPANLIELFEDINLNLPVIAMNGSVLYDISKNKYLHKIPIKREIVEQIDTILESEDAGCFYNTLIQDTLLIYFGEFHNMVMQEIYRDLKKNPYRNYVCGILPENVKIIYLYIIDDSLKIQRIIQKINQSELKDQIRIATGTEKKYNNYSYLKIYSKEATREHMIKYLQQIVGAKQTITFGNEIGEFDHVMPDGNEEKVVRAIKSIYRPYIWKKDKG